MPASSPAFRRSLRTKLRARIAALPGGDPLEGTFVTTQRLTLEELNAKAIGFDDWRTIARDEGPMRGPARRQVNETALQSGSIAVTTSALDEAGLDALEDLAWALVELLEATLLEGEGVFGADQNRRPAMLASLLEERGSMGAPEQTGQYTRINFTISYDARL
jgi:hypothetical protein